MSSAIEVKDISKSYIINHKNKASYNTLKDDFANLIKRPIGKGSEGTEENFWALKDVSFEVPQGEIFGVIGKNGSGKSTLLKILSRIVDPTKGSIHIRGRVASLLEVGTGFHPELTGRENIFFNGSMLGMSKKEIAGKFNEIVAFSEIEQFIDTPVKFYSSGMYVRLAFAVAAHLEPEILILDEVLAVGDASFQKKSMNKILSTMQSGRTVLFVSHNMGAVRQLCTKGILLNKGNVEMSGDVGAIIDRYMLTAMNDDEVDLVLHPTWKRTTELKNDYFVPENFCVVDEDGKVMQGKLKREHDYWVKLDGNLKTTDDKFTAGYAIWDKDSKNLIYMSLMTDGPKHTWPKLKKGDVTLLGKLPKDFLNQDTYRISGITAMYGKFWIHDAESTPVRIGITIDGKFSDSPYWHDLRGGVTAPIIDDWKLRAN